MKCMKNLKKSILSICLSVFLLCCCVFGHCFTLESFAASTLLKGFLNLIGISSEVAPTSRNFNGVDWQQIAIEFMRGDSLGADGGHSRDNPYVVNTNPIDKPRSVVESRSSSGRNYIDCYNPVTNNYETVNNTYFNDYSDTYIFETTNNFISYEFNETYYTICVAPVQSPTQGKFFNVYYQLPDGRNSFNLTPDDVRGIVFNYNIVDYNRTVLDSSVVGLWRLDGNYINDCDSSYVGAHGYNNYNFVDGRFGGGVCLSPNSGTMHLWLSEPLENDFTLEYWVFVPYQETILASSVFYADNNGAGYTANDFVGNKQMNATVSQGAWNCIVAQSDGRIWVNGDEATNYNLPCFDAFDGVLHVDHQYYDSISTSLRLVYRNGEECKVNVGGEYYYECDGIEWVFDEIKVSNGLKYFQQNVSFRQEPWDLPFAYTVPFGTPSFSFDTLNSISLDTDYEVFVKTPSRDNGSNGAIGLFKLKYSDLTGFVPQPYFANSSYLSFNTIYKLKFKFYKSGDYLVCGFSFYNLDGDLVHSDVYTNGQVRFNDVVFPCSVIFGSGGDFDYMYLQSVSFNPPVSTIGVQSPFNVNNFQVGGVRPLYPSDGDLFISFFRGVVSSVIQYYDGIWREVNASVFFQGQWIDVKEFDFTNLMLISDSKELSSSSGGTYIINEGSSYTYITSVSGNDLITVSGNDLNITIDSGDVDSSKLSDFINSIPLIFAFVGTVLGSMFPFLPVWLSSLIIGCLSLLFGFIVVKFIRR